MSLPLPRFLVSKPRPVSSSLNESLHVGCDVLARFRGVPEAGILGQLCVRQIPLRYCATIYRMPGLCSYCAIRYKQGPQVMQSDAGNGPRQSSARTFLSVQPAATHTSILLAIHFPTPKIGPDLPTLSVKIRSSIQNWRNNVQRCDTGGNLKQPPTHLMNPVR